MANRKSSKATKFCVYARVPRFGASDEITGYTLHSRACFASEKKAQALAARSNAKEAASGEPSAHYLVQGPGYDYHGFKRPKVSPFRQHQKSMQARRRTRAGSIPF